MKVIMAVKDLQISAKHYVPTPQPVQGLLQVVRHITTHGVDGKSVFLSP